MSRFTYYYRTPLGNSFEDVYADGPEEAERGFWGRHHPDTCMVWDVSSTPCDYERDEGAEKRREQPAQGSEGVLGPGVVAAGQGDEGGPDREKPDGAVALAGLLRSLFPDGLVDHDLLLFGGHGDQVEVKQLTKHRFLVRSPFGCERLEAPFQVSRLARVLADLPEVRERVRGHGAHGGPNRGEAAR